MAVNMANAFADNKIENALVCTRTSGPLEKFMPENTKFFELRKGSSLDLIAFIRLIRIINSMKPDIIHAHSTSIYWGIGLKLLKPRVKLIWHDHDGMSENLKDSDRRSLKWLSKKINGIVAVNEILCGWSLRNMKTVNVFFLRNFPYLKDFNHQNSRDKNIILHLANLRPQKDHFTLFKAIKLLKERSSFKFEVWCAGNDSQDAHSHLLKDTVREFKLDGEIKFLGGVEDTLFLLERATIGILSSHSEGLPVSLLEYGLAALPVVVTNVGQCAEVVDHGKCGTVVAASNPRELADALEWHIQNRVDSINLGAKFKQHVEENYGSQRFIEDYQKMLNGL